MQPVCDCRSHTQKSQLVFIVRFGVECYLDKEWNGVEPSDDNSVVNIPGQDMQSSRAAFYYFLHTYTLLCAIKWGETKSNIQNLLNVSLKYKY